MELIIEEQPVNQEGPNPFKDFVPFKNSKRNRSADIHTQSNPFTPRIPTNKQPINSYERVSNQETYRKREQQPLPPPPPPQRQPREAWKQPSYHQKYQQIEKRENTNTIMNPVSTFSYDHILQSLNMKVNNGKLEYKLPSHSLEKTNQKIINHYFERPVQYQPEPPKTITREEYNRRLAYYYWKQREERKRISQIKSKKMLYPGNNNIQISRPSFKQRWGPTLNVF